MSKIATLVRAAAGAEKPTVIALHCSGASRSEWRHLERDLGPRITTVALDLMGPDAAAHWAGAHSFSLSDEAAQIVRIIDGAKQPVHLVGHSYGGSVALRAAIERPTKIASMTLYEPVAFHLLKTGDDEGKFAFAEISRLAGDVERLVLSGNHHVAAKRFFEYWNEPGSWAAMRDDFRAAFARYIPKARFEFSAAINERAALHVYRRLNFPVLLLHGEHAPASTQIIIRQLAKAMRFSSLRTVYQAGHMGPVSHAAVVSAMMADWILHLAPDFAAHDLLAAPEIGQVA